MLGFTFRAEAGNQLVILTDTLESSHVLMKATKEPITGYVMEHEDGTWQYNYFDKGENWARIYRTQERMLDAIYAL